MPPICPACAFGAHGCAPRLIKEILATALPVTRACTSSLQSQFKLEPLMFKGTQPRSQLFSLF